MIEKQEEKRLLKAMHFPLWAGKREECKLSKFALRGLVFEDVPRTGVYAFSKGEAQALDYAVQYVGKERTEPADTEKAAAGGWQFVGQFSKRRYFWSERGSAVPLSQILNSEAERSFLRLWRRRFLLLMALNLPGTLYCAFFTLMFFINGFGIAEILRTFSTAIYLWGALLGVFAYTCLAFWHSETKNRLKSIL